MACRLNLQTMLETLLGSRNVYYQPPESVKMLYPAIVYSRSNIDNTFADNLVYMQTHAYQLIVIDEDPDSEIVKKVSALPTCRFVRHIEKDDHNHDILLNNY